MPRALRPTAIDRSELPPAKRIAWIAGARSTARRFALSIRAARARAQSVQVPARPRKPPSCLPRAFAAANAARVRSDIIRASFSATAASIWIVSRLAAGKRYQQKSAEHPRGNAVRHWRGLRAGRGAIKFLREDQAHRIVSDAQSFISPETNRSNSAREASLCDMRCSSTYSLLLIFPLIAKYCAILRYLA